MAILLLVLFTIPALWPLLRPGFFASDDGLFHLYRLAALDAAWHRGVLYPRWFPDFAFGYGYPVLNFYSPLSYYFAQVLHLLGWGYIAATKGAFGASLLLSTLTMYLFAREALPRPAALLAALAYLYVPYHLGDVYRRGALAEAWAFVFFPLVLWACHRLILRREAGYILLLALAYAGLILVHNLSAMIFAPLLLAYGLWLSWHAGPLKGRTLLWLVLAFLLAGGLGAFYILPVRADAPFAHLIYDFNSTGYRRHLAPLWSVVSPFAIYRYFPEQGVAAERPLGLAQALLAIGSLGLLAWRLAREQPFGHLAFWWLAGLVSLAMTTQASLPIWLLFQPLLSMVQYPWRFMALVDLSTAYLIGSLVSGMEQRFSSRLPSAKPADGAGWPMLPRPDLLVSIPALLLAVPLLVNALPGAIPKTLPLADAEVTVQRMWQEDYAAHQIGATWTAEYLPLSVREERWVIPRPPLQPQMAVPLSEAPVIALGEQGLLSHEFFVDSAKGFPLRLHAFHFPGWQGYVDGEAMPTYPSGSLGLVTLEVPPGKHLVRVAFEDTTVRRLGAMLSTLSLLATLAGLVLWRRQVIVLAIGVLACLAVLTSWHLWPFAFGLQPVRRQANLAGQAMLLGYTVDNPRSAPGDRVQVTLYWLSLRSMEQNYKVFVHLVDDAGNLRAQHDGDPVYGFTPTTRWLPGEVIIDRHDIVLPGDLSPGRYSLLAGMYEFATMRNLALLNDEEAEHLGNRVRLGEVMVGPYKP